MEQQLSPRLHLAGPAWRGALLGLGAAFLFGVSAPLAKLLLPETGPLRLAGLLYLGAGLGLSLLAGRRRRQAAWRPGAREAGLRRADLGLLLVVTLAGGVVGPVLLLVGLERVSGVAGALLLNLEAPFTILLAVAAFGDHLDRRGAVASLLVVAGALLLAWQPGEVDADWLGVLAIAGACASWGLDNNLTQRLSLRDPVAIVRVKAFGAAACTLTLAALVGEPWPAYPVVLAALGVGALSYGLSLVLDVYALRLLGAAREAAFFATAPFVGAMAAVPLLGESVGLAEAAAGGLMAAGVVLLLRERHGHLHTHEALEHDHLHAHDEHHQHEHEGPVIEPHSHPHWHAPLVHDHPHVPDAHHRHRH